MKPKIEKRGIILAYLAEEQQAKVQARYEMHQAEELFKRAAGQYALSENVITDLLDDLNDVDEVPPQGYEQIES